MAELIYWHNPKTGAVWSDVDVRFHCKDTTGWTRIVLPPPAGAQQAVAISDEQIIAMSEHDEFWRPLEGYDGSRHEIDAVAFARAILALAAPAVAQGAVDPWPTPMRQPAKKGAGYTAIISKPWGLTLEEYLWTDCPADMQLLREGRCFERHLHAVWACEAIEAGKRALPSPATSGTDTALAATPAPEAAPTAALMQISDLLSSMFSGARAHVRGEDEEVVGYTVRNGALHKIVGILASYKPVIIPANLPKAHETITGLLCGTSEAAPSAKEGERG